MTRLRVIREVKPWETACSGGMDDTSAGHPSSEAVEDGLLWWHANNLMFLAAP